VIEFLSAYMTPLLLLLLAGVMFVVGFFLYRKKKSDGVGKSEMDYKQEAFKVIPYPIIIINSNDILLYINPIAEKVLRTKLRRAIGKDYKTLFSLTDFETKLSINNLEKLSHSSDWKECELSLKGKKILTAEMHVIPIGTDYSKRKKQSYVLSFKDITERKTLEAKLEIVEKRDSLTNLYNRKALEAQLNAVMRDSRKHGAKHVFFHLTIDQFKNINDTIGYTAGDSLIRQVATLLRKSVDNSIDFVARLNADEFAIVLRERSFASAVKIMMHIRTTIDEEFRFVWNGVTYPVTISGGFVLVDKKSTTPARVLANADLTCSIARQRGGNRIVAYREDDPDVKKAQDNIKGVWNLKQAFKDNRFRLFAQPIHALAPSKYALPFSHYEVLIRMYDEDGNIIPPDEFIPVAENYGMMPVLDRWVVKDVIKQLKAVKQQAPLPVFAINLSGTSLDDEGFLAFVLNEINTAKIDPRMLCFEITEQVAISNLDLAEKFIDTLREMGSSFSLDDFGTGVSSYGYLRSLKVDYLKIDGIFIKDILTDDVARAMVQSIVQVGHTMGLKIIAEYVENDEIIELLRLISIDYGQGYGISKPEPLDEMLKIHI